MGFGSSGISKDAVLEALRVVEDPDVHRSIVELDMVRGIDIRGKRVKVDVVLTVPGCPLRAKIEGDVRRAVMGVDGVEAVEVTVGTMNDEEREAFAAKVRGKRPPTAPSPLLDPATPTRFLAVASGKGGVGKSTVTANLAVALARLGHRVGVVDADIYGFSLPNIFGIPEAKPAIVSNLIMPVQVSGVKLVSMHFFVPDNNPVIWRGPMLGKMLRNFFQEVHWGDLDVMLLDLPPGTGDIALDVHQLLPQGRELIVTTPQGNAADVAVRAGLMAIRTNHEILGVVENMSYFECGNCGERAYLFGRGGGQRVAGELSVPLLGQVPVGTMDEGAPGLFPEKTPQGESFAALAKRIATALELDQVPAAP